MLIFKSSLIDRDWETSGENDTDNHNCTVSVRLMQVDHFDLYVENVDDGFEDRNFIMAAVFITP